MTSPSIKGQISQALSSRLASITTANGYLTNVKKIYSDKIPMGIQLNKQQLPAIFVLDGADLIDMQMGVVAGNWDFRLQLWHAEVGDIAMNEFSRDVFKSIYADSASASRVDAFRGLHQNIGRKLRRTDGARRSGDRGTPHPKSRN